MTLKLEPLAGLAWAQLWQVTVVIAAVAFATRWGCRSRPHLAHLLWLVVLVKCWVPPLWSSPTGIFSWSRMNGRHAVVHSEPVRRVPLATPAHSSGTELAETPTSTAIEADASSVNVPAFDGRADSAEAPESRLGWFALATWLSGATVVVAITTARGLRWRRNIRAGASPMEPAIESLVAELAAKLGLRRAPRVLVTSFNVGPAVYGLLRPTLLLPEFLVTGKSREQLAPVLAHELIHVRRGDLAVGLWRFITQAAWWFHPLVWWAGCELDRERERSCDEEVVAALRCEPTAYAQSLLDILKSQRRLRALPAWPGMRPIDITRRRLEHIVARGAFARARTPRRYWLAATVMFLLAAPGAELRLAALTALAEEDRRTAAKESGSQKALEKPGPAASANDNNQIREGDSDAAAEKPARQDDEAVAAQAAIRRAIDRGVAYLKSQQKGDGMWRDVPGYPGGITALCTLALLKSGVPAGDDAVQRSVAQLRKLTPQNTYATSLATLVFCAAEPERDQRQIERQVEWLAGHQKQAGAMTGAWGYPQADGDNSNSGFALLALYEADRVGVHVEKDVWRRALDYWRSAQNPNGSWGYKPSTPGTGSMTCQGLACVAAASDVLDQREPEQPGPQAIERASQWLGRNFSVQINPGAGSKLWRAYYLHALARAGQLSERREFGNHDWYAEGAKALLDLQTVPDGFWKFEGHAESDPIIATSLALLFLSHEK